jgi:hypothetical protein
VEPEQHTAHGKKRRFNVSLCAPQRGQAKFGQCVLQLPNVADAQRQVMPKVDRAGAVYRRQRSEFRIRRSRFAHLRQKPFHLGQRFRHRRHRGHAQPKLTAGGDGRVNF